MIGSQHDAAIEPRQRNRASVGFTIDRQADVDRPVAPLLTILARSINRIDDPHAALAAPRRVVLFLFGEQAVVWSGRAQCVTQKLIGCGVSGIAKSLAFQHSRVTNFQQNLPGLNRQFRSELCVGHSRNLAHFNGMICSMM